MGKKRNKSKISQSNISIIKCFDKKIESDDPYFVSLKINLENNLKIDFIGKWYLGEEIGVNYYCDK